MKLEPIHFRAIGNLAFGMSVHDVARDCDSSTQSIYRWLADLDFKATVEAEIAKRQSVAPYQIQTIATESIEGQIDSERELRSFSLGAKPPDYSRVLALMTLKKFGQRWLELAGYDPKLKEKASKLFFQLPRDPKAQDCPDLLPTREECGPGDRKQRPQSEFDPPPPGLGARTFVDIAEFAKADRLARGLANKQELEELQGLELQGSGVRGQGSEQPEGGEAAASVAQASSLRVPCATGGLSTSANAEERIHQTETQCVTNGSVELPAQPTATDTRRQDAGATTAVTAADLEAHTAIGADGRKYICGIPVTVGHIPDEEREPDPRDEADWAEDEREWERRQLERATEMVAELKRAAAAKEARSA